MILNVCGYNMEFKKLSKGAIIAVVIAGLLLTVTTAAVLTSNQVVPLSGSITAVNVGVYSDSGCTQTATALNVGAINPGGTATQTVYIKNTGNVPETLTMAASNWSPSNATLSLTLTWNQQNTILSAGNSVPAVLTVTAASNCGSMTTFSCSVTITGTQ